MGGSKETTNTSSQQKTNYSSTSSPLDWQSSALQNAFGEANALNGYDATSSQPDFNTYTGLNNTEKSAFNQMASTGQNNVNTGTSLLGQSYTGANALDQALGASSAGASGNYDKGTSGVSQELMGNASTALSSGNTALSNAIASAGTDSTAQNIADANSYMNSSGVQNAVNSAIKSSDDLYNSTTAPSLNAQAEAGGNINSSRAGAASALSQALQADNDQNTASSMLASAWQNGLDLAEQARQSNLSGNLSAASDANSAANTALDGQTAANSLSQQNNATGIDWSQLLGEQGDNAVNQASTGQALQSAGIDSILNSGSDQQTAATDQNQANLTADEQAEQYPWSELEQYMNVIGSNNWGQQTSGNQNSTGQSTQTTTTSSSPLSTALGALGAIGGLGASLMTGGSTSLLGSLLGGTTSSASSNPFAGAGTMYVNGLEGAGTTV
ncbi:hypothetical protein [Acetobacter sp. UBA5411]|uniref:hypothetical protein n=1 Tax=Acetobacter sp. UBA5411 TaxID=1945905 RepID=UPI0025C1FDE6|nr:hypothetical protein [Acetobacter sp. UBA5411]